MKTLSYTLSALAIAFAMNGCIREKAAPDLPPSGSMTMTFDDFWGGSTKAAAGTKFNFLFAGTRVLIWNAVLTVELAIPVAVFAEAFNHQPVWDNIEEAWIWSYSIPYGVDLYTAKLHGVKSDDEAEWSMYISKTGGFSDFLWYTGTSKTDNSEGSWTVYKGPLNPVAFLQIDWNKYSETESEITYLNITPGSEENGGYITYGITDDPVLNAFYDIYVKGQDNLINIKWNQTTHAGRVKSFNRFMDDNWHCWDEVYDDVPCE